MRNWNILVSAVLALFVSSCSQTESELAVTGTPSRTYVINASAKSCVTKRTEDSSNPSPNDVGAAFFQVQYMTVNWPNPDKTLIIASLRLKFQGPQFAGGGYVCEFAGDALLALNDVWWSKGEAAAGGPEIASYKAPLDVAQRYTPAQSIPITCPIICGGLSAATAYQASGTIDIIGFSRDAAGEMTPERTTGFISIESLGD